MFRKLLEFLGLSKKPAVDLPCSPCRESCEQPADCFKNQPAPDVAELVEPAIVEQFYRQDSPPTPTPVEPVATIPVPSTKKKVKAPAVKTEKKEKKDVKKAATPAITAPKKKKTPAKKK